MNTFLRTEFISTNGNNFELTEINRCGTLSAAKAAEMKYTEFDVEKFRKRVDSIKNSMTMEGLHPMSVITICILDTHNFIVDGQGRFAALTELNLERINNGEAPLTIRADFYQSETLDDVRNAFLFLNDSLDKHVATKKLSAVEKLHSSMIGENADEDLRAGIDLALNFYRQKIGGSETAMLNFIFGQGSTKKNMLPNNKSSLIKPFVNVMVDDYHDILEVADSHFGKTSNHAATFRSISMLNAFRNIYSKLYNSDKAENVIENTKDFIVKSLKSIVKEMDVNDLDRFKHTTESVITKLLIGGVYDNLFELSTLKKIKKSNSNYWFHDVIIPKN